MKNPPANIRRNIKPKPSLSINNGNELSLSGPALVEILRAVLDKGVLFRFRAKGFSMSPFIKDGDVITVSPLSHDSLCLGDVGAFVRPNRETVVVHRVIGEKGDHFLVKGDNTSDANELIPKANLSGRVTKVERNGKEVSLGLGPERYLISFLTRKNLLLPLLSPLRRLVWRFVKRLAF